MDKFDKEVKLKDGQEISLLAMFKTVRQLLGNESLSVNKVKEFMRSPMFQSVFPDWFEAFKQVEQEEKLLEDEVMNFQNIKKEKEDVIRKVKKEVVESSCNDRENDKKVVKKVKIEVKKEGESCRKGMVMVKVKKEEEEVGDKQKKRKRLISSSSDSEDIFVKVKKEKKEYHHQEDKKARLDCSSSPSDNNSRNRGGKENDKIKTESKKQSIDAGASNSAGTSAARVHPFYQRIAFQPKGKLFGDRGGGGEHSKKHKKTDYDYRRKKQPPPHKKEREAKPFSYYIRQNARFKSGKHWKPVEDSDFRRYQRRFKLQNFSILCLDLGELRSRIHLKKHMRLSDSKLEEISAVDKAKRSSFSALLKRLYNKNRTDKDRRASGSLDEASTSKKQRSIAGTDSSDSNFGQRSNKHKGNKDLSKEERRLRLEQLQEEKNKGTRKLPWENSEYFDKKKEGAGTSRPGTSASTSKKEPIPIKVDKPIAKIPKLHNPTPIQKILQEIAQATQKAGQKHVDIKIPKYSESEKKAAVQESVKKSTVAEEVERVLYSQEVIEYPKFDSTLMTTNTDAYFNYTVRKMAWWYLKEEENPPDTVLFHPELYDNKVYEDGFDPTEHADDIDEDIGCVSDPEGLDEKDEELRKKNKLPDADLMDEYCGCAGLQSRYKMRQGEQGEMVTTRWMNVMPGCNYERSGFQAKCFLCQEKVKGKRALGAHIRSEAHKNRWRNESLKYANYEEVSEKVISKEVFTARLPNYRTSEAATAVSAEEVTEPLEDRQLVVGADGSDSPMAVIESRPASPAPEAIRPADDELSLPSLTQFDVDWNDPNETKAKICLRTNGKWSKEMEARWIQLEERKTRLLEEYIDQRERYVGNPESHPRHDEEWKEFWSTRADELEEQGKDPDSHESLNIITQEWHKFWLKRVQEIMKGEADAKVLQVKMDLGLDVETLKALCMNHGLTPESVDLGGPKPIVSWSIKSKSTDSTVRRGSKDGGGVGSGTRKPQAPPPPRISSWKPAPGGGTSRRDSDDKRKSDNRGRDGYDRRSAERIRHDNRKDSKDSKGRSRSPERHRRSRRSRPRSSARRKSHWEGRRRSVKEIDRPRAPPGSGSGSDWEVDSAQTKQNLDVAINNAITGDATPPLPVPKVSSPSNKQCGPPAASPLEAAGWIYSPTDWEEESPVLETSASRHEVVYEPPTMVKNPNCSPPPALSEPLPSFLPIFNSNTAKPDGGKPTNFGSLAAAWEELQEAIQAAEDPGVSTSVPYIPSGPTKFPSNVQGPSSHSLDIALRNVCSRNPQKMAFPLPRILTAPDVHNLEEKFFEVISSPPQSDVVLAASPITCSLSLSTAAADWSNPFCGANPVNTRVEMEDMTEAQSVGDQTFTPEKPPSLPEEGEIGSESDSALSRKKKKKKKKHKIDKHRAHINTKLLANLDLDKNSLGYQVMKRLNGEGGKGRFEKY